MLILLKSPDLMSSMYAIEETKIEENKKQYLLFFLLSVFSYLLDKKMTGIYMVSAQKPTAVTHSILGKSQSE